MIMTFETDDREDMQAVGIAISQAFAVKSKTDKKEQTCKWHYCDVSMMIWSKHKLTCGMKEEECKDKPYCPICGKRIEVVS